MNVCKFLFFIMLGMFFSCKNTQTNLEVYNLSKSEYYSLGDSVFYPRNICCIDSFIIIGDHDGNKLYSVFNKDNIDFVTSFGEKGEAPNELIFSENMRKFNGNKMIYIYDRVLGKICHISPDNLFDGIIYHSNNPKFIGLNNIIMLDDSLYVGLTYNESSRLAIIDKDSVFLTDIGYPDDKILASNRQKSLVYQGRLLNHPTKDLLVFSSIYGKVLEIYQVNREKMNIGLVHREVEIFPQYKPIDVGDVPHANFTEDNVTGVLDVDITNDYIYLLYSGKTVKDSDKNFANRIDVYNWNGEYLSTFQLDEKLAAFCVDNAKLYGITYTENDCSLFVYNMPSVERN